MKIADNPPGLVSREIVSVRDGIAKVREEWDITVPGCPMIINPFNPPPDAANVTGCVRIFDMPLEQAQAILKR